MDIKTTFSPGDTIFILRQTAKMRNVVCTFCAGQGTITGKDGSKRKCPEYCQMGVKSVQGKPRYHIEGPLTVGKVIVEIIETPGVKGQIASNYAAQSKRTESYMCVETGVGSGHVYRLDNGIFGSYDIAEKECDKRNENNQ